MEIQFLKKRCAKISSRVLLLLVLSLNGTSSWSQEYISTEIEEEILKNEAYLSSQISYLKVFGDMITFKENEHIGLKKLNSGKVILPAVYDSIISTDGYRFITVKGTEYKLLGLDLWQWFDSKVITIHFYNKIYTVVDTDNKTSRYQVIDDGGKIMPLDNPINHLIYKPQNNGNTDPVNYVYTDKYAGEFLDSIQFIRTPNNKEVILYKNGQEYWRKSGGAEGYEMFGSECIDTYSIENDLKKHQIYDLKTLKLLFSVESKELQYFNHLGHEYVRAHGTTENSSKTLFYTIAGDLVLDFEENIEFAQGLLFKKEQENYPGRQFNFTLYSFPENQLIESGINNLDYYFPFVLGYKTNTEAYNVYYQGKLLQTFPGIGHTIVSSYGIFPNTNNGVVCIQMEDQKGENRRYLLISSTGKLLAESDLSINCSYNEQFEQISVHFGERKGKIYRDQFGIYDEENDQVQMINFRNPNWQQVNENIILYYDYYYNKKTRKDSESIYFIDLKGNCVNESVFSDEQILRRYNEILYIALFKDNVPVIYNSELRQLCDSCYFTEFATGYEKTGEFVVAKREMNSIFTQVYNQNMELILPDRYLAATYNSWIKSFIVLTEDNKVKYIPLSETTLAPRNN